MKKLQLTIILIASATMLLAQSKISDKLWENINEATNNGSTVEAIIFLEDQYDIHALDKQLKEQKATTHERGVKVNTELRKHAEITQRDLVEFMKSKSPSEVIQHKSFWITNAIYLVAMPEIVLELANHPDITSLEANEKTEPLKPVSSKPGYPKFPFPGQAEPGLKVINAHKMWELGFTGENTIVANLDLGVKGDHPALQSNWHGNNVPWQQAWYDPASGSTFPTDPHGHGTFCMGIEAGIDNITSDTIGVAINAEWIAAKTNLNTPINLMALEWFLDPDNNPNTTEDMPDVVNNSWLHWEQCSDLYLEAILNLEVAGVAMVFAAGNDGPGPGTVGNPADLNATEMTVFAVGAVNGYHLDLPVANFSSRGPTACTTGTGDSIKPEVVAPGMYIRSSDKDGTYSYGSGTSFATPHVAGAIALLKQAFPNKTGNELKQMLYDNARDLGPLGEDNTYGMGVIDVYQAYFVNRFPETPKPPTNVITYSDYLTPSSVTLSWTDPEEIVGGGALTNFEIQIWRDNELLTGVTSGEEMYLDEGLVDGQDYQYELFAIDLDTDSLSLGVLSFVYCGGSPFPAPPEDVDITYNGLTGVTISWIDPTTQSDSTPLDDLEKILIYHDEEQIAEVEAGTEIFIDNGYFVSNSANFYSLRSVDNEIPEHISDFTDQIAIYTGDHPEILVWVGQIVTGTGELSGDSIFRTIYSFNPDVYLTKNLYEFGEDLNIYDAIFIILGVWPYKSILNGPSGNNLEQYLEQGGNLYLEGADSYNYDPTIGGYNIKPWFNLNQGSDGEMDVYYVDGINELDTLSFKYVGGNTFMDELVPLNSTTIFENPYTNDIMGVWWDEFGNNGAKTIGVVPSYGGLVDTTNSCFEEYLLCRYLDYFGYEFDCDSVLLYCPHPCLPEGITFSTQEEIDNFQLNYPGCTEIEGDVEINGVDITNLNGLNVITAIYENLKIGTIGQGTSLTDLTGLSNLSLIGGSVEIIHNDSLINLTGLENIMNIYGSLKIGIPYYPTYHQGNPLLIDLTGLDNLVSIGEDLVIWGNDNLINFSGLNALALISGDVSICENDSLTNLSGLESLTSIHGNMQIGEFSGSPNGLCPNLSLESLSGLNNLNSIAGSLQIELNPNLQNLQGLNNLNFIGDGFIVSSNGALTTLAGIDCLPWIGGGFEIFNNSNLNSLSGANSLNYIGGELNINGNIALTSLTGLDSIEPASITDLKIIGNSSLYDCDIWPICQYLADTSTTAEIHNNATECNSVEEVLEHCLTEIAEYVLTDKINIYPNPLGSNTLITYTLENNSSVTLKILDLSGRLVVSLVNEFQHQGEQRVVLNTEGLKPGIYFCTLKTNEGMQTKKIIKL